MAVGLDGKLLVKPASRITKTLRAAIRANVEAIRKEVLARSWDEFEAAMRKKPRARKR